MLVSMVRPNAAGRAPLCVIHGHCWALVKLGLDPVVCQQSFLSFLLGTQRDLGNAPRGFCAATLEMFPNAAWQGPWDAACIMRGEIFNHHSMEDPPEVRAELRSSRHPLHVSW